MLVELIGSTGVGKSTLADHLLRVLAERGQPALTSEQFVMRCYGLRLERFRSRVAASLVLDLLIFPWFLRFARRHAGLCWFMACIAWRDIELPLLRLNVLRNFAKHMGTHELLRRRASPNELIILDEGLVHQAHNLFVHPTTAPRPLELARFVAEVPLPDLLVLVDGPMADLVGRTIRRGHPRVRSGAAGTRFARGV